MAFAIGHNMDNHFHFDGLGYTFIALATAWTILLAGGMFFLVINRHLPFLRIRNLPLALSAVATLHVYWCLCMLAYVLNGNFPCDTEFWIMSLYLPLGIALYQANNTQLRHIAATQSKFATSNLALGQAPQRRLDRQSWRKPVAKWRSMTSIKRAMTCIGIGMAAQLLCSSIIFLMSRRFHAGWGIIGQGNPQVTLLQRSTCRQGWEWMPSIVWQFFWAWVYAPYLLWKVRGVEDIHCWRLQTVLCSIAGLPASPLWLAALYAKAFRPISKYWIAPMWFAPCIFLMEFSVIFIPCWQILKNRRLKKETLGIIAEWEKKQNSNASIGSDSTCRTRRSHISHKGSLKSGTGSRRSEMYTMKALDKAIETNPTPLLLFSSFKDFSGENIQFLSQVQQWKARWEHGLIRHGLLRKTTILPIEANAFRREQYNLAVQIYSSFVSLQYSDFPVNLSSAHHKDLEAMFNGAAALVNAHLPEDTVTPFNNLWSLHRSEDEETGRGRNHISVVSTVINRSTDTFLPSSERLRKETKNINLFTLGVKVPSFVEVPDSFGPNAFDNAEDSIKYIVLTNTWPKFVADGFANTLEKQSFKIRVTAWTDRCVGQWAKSVGR